jgi:hypothetical protein
MAKHRRGQDEETDAAAAADAGEDKELTDEQLARREELRAQGAARASGQAPGPGVVNSEPDQNFKTDAEANGGKTVKEPELAVVGYDKEGKPIKENRREARLRAEAERGPLARYEFRLMVGGHQGQDYDAPIMMDTDTLQARKDRRRPTRTYAAGERVWDNIDLAKVFNRPNSIKFRLVKDWGPTAYTDGVDPEAHRRPKRAGGRPGENAAEEEPEVPKKDDLREMSVGELRELAAREEVDLPGSHATKDEIIDTLHSEMRKKSRQARSHATHAGG